MKNGGNYPYWTRWIKDENLKKAIGEILEACQRISNYSRRTDEADPDVEGARADLRDTLTQIYESGNGSENPLWAAVMQIRPRVIGARLDPVQLQYIASELWNIRNNDGGNEEKTAFFGRLAMRINGRDISIARAIISGGVYEERKKGEKPELHCFPGIPYAMRKEAGVKLTTHPDNVQAVVKAYEIMLGKAADGPAKQAIEANIDDIKIVTKPRERVAK